MRNRYSFKPEDKKCLGNLSINSMANKFDQLGLLVEGKVNIIIITEPKSDSALSSSQFMMNGYSVSYRFDRKTNGTQVLINIWEGILDHIPSKRLIDQKFIPDTEGLFIELNLQNNKWFLFGLYHLPSQSINVSFIK